MTKSNEERYGRLSEREYRQLMYIRAAHERALKRKRREQRIARAFDNWEEKADEK